MSENKCPRCGQQAGPTTRLCSYCGLTLRGGDAPARGGADPRGVRPADGSRRGRAQGRVCPRCQGTGKHRDRSWLPWNNLASLCVVVGLAGMISSACLEWNTREIFFGGLVMSMIGVGMYMAGNRCPRCGGSGKLEGAVMERERRTVQIRYGGPD